MLTFTVRLNIEGLVAGIDLSKVSDTNLAAEADPMVRAALVEAMGNADPDWGKFQQQTEGLVLMQEDKIMAPTGFSP